MVKTRMNALKNEEEVKEVVERLVNDSIDEKPFDFEKEVENQLKVQTLIDRFEDVREELKDSHSLKLSMQEYVEYFHPYLKNVFEISGIYMMGVITHYLSARSYAYYCTPSDLQGIVMSPFLASAPHCRALRWSLQHGAQTIDNMWIVFGTWVCAKVAKATA